MTTQEARRYTSAIDIGIAGEDRKQIAEGLSRLLADLLTQRKQVHEKTAWMLRSLLER